MAPSRAVLGRICQLHIQLVWTEELRLVFFLKFWGSKHYLNSNSVFVPTLLQGARHPDMGATVSGQQQVSPWREQVVIMEEDDQEEDDTRSGPDLDPVYTISNDLRLQQTRIHGGESQSYSKYMLESHDVSQRRMVTVHDVINRTMEGHESLGQRCVIISHQMLA